MLKLRRMDRAPHPGVFVVPGGATVPVASSLVIVWLLSNMTWAETVGLGSLLAVATVVYAVWFRRR